jgi:hypothetical protein
MRGPHARSGAGAPVVDGGKTNTSGTQKGRRNTGLSAYGATQSQDNLHLHVFCCPAERIHKGVIISV